MKAPCTDSMNHLVLGLRVVPETMKEEVLRDLHEGVMGGHLGEDKTLEKVKERFYWPGYHNDVKNWVNTCSDCAARKTPIPRNRAALQSYQSWIANAIGVH